MIAPIHRMKLEEIRKAAAFRCQHGHTGLEHYDCYVRSGEPLMAQRVGFLDIETSNLEANFGIMLTYAIKDQATGNVYCDTLDKQDIKKYEDDKTDTRLVGNFVDDLLKFDRIVTFYGKGFDIPFARTRALIDGVDFPYFGSIKHDDVYFWAKFKLRLNRNGLETVCRTLLGKTDKTHLEYRYWAGAVRGDEDSLEYILAHNIHDVDDTQKVYDVLKDFARRQDSSI